MEDAACHHKTAALPTSWRQLQNLKEFRAKRAAAAGCQNKSCFRLAKLSWIEQNTACDEEILGNEKLRQKRSRSKEPRPKVQKGKHQAHCSTAPFLFSTKALMAWNESLKQANARGTWGKRTLPTSVPSVPSIPFGPASKQRASNCYGRFSLLKCLKEKLSWAPVRSIYNLHANAIGQERQE